jgi:hypothetical protein
MSPIKIINNCSSGLRTVDAGSLITALISPPVYVCVCVCVCVCVYVRERQRELFADQWTVIFSVYVTVQASSPIKQMSNGSTSP